MIEQRTKGALGRYRVVLRIFSAKEQPMPAKPIPEGYHTATPYLVVKGADKTIAFMKQAFGATAPFEPMMSPDGKVMHADLMIGDSHVMLSEASEQHPAMQSMIHLYVPNVDAVYQRAVAAGGKSFLEPTDQFYGDRGAGVKDQSGCAWYIATHIEDVSMAELKKRAAEMHKKGKAA
jgi:PhnB protein